MFAHGWNCHAREVGWSNLGEKSTGPALAELAALRNELSAHRQFRSDLRLMTTMLQRTGAVLMEMEDDGKPILDEQQRAGIAQFIVDNADYLAEIERRRTRGYSVQGSNEEKAPMPGA